MAWCNKNECSNTDFNLQIVRKHLNVSNVCPSSTECEMTFETWADTLSGFDKNCTGIKIYWINLKLWDIIIHVAMCCHGYPSVSQYTLLCPSKYFRQICVLFFLSDFMSARDLVTAMISNNHMFRPNALEVMYHCLFWPPDKQLAFFQVCNVTYHFCIS